MTQYPSYSVAIRTLGTAGEKYLETLRSVERQSVQPENIYVYIPHGYELPKETIGKEIYVRCEKGMVTQRSLRFDEIKSEFILFLDDDLSFKEDFVEILFNGIIEKQGDCICPNIYPNHKERFIYKIRNYFGGTKPHFKKDWAFIIRKDGHYSYNNNPSQPVLLTQSGAGACSLCRKSTYLSIHFEDERWIEQYPYALGDDQLFFYKMYLYGHRVLTSYSAQITHLDAGTGHVKDSKKFSYFYSYLDYIVWRRSVYDVQSSLSKKIMCSISYNIIYFLRSLPLSILIMIYYRTPRGFINSLKGLRDAKKYVKSDQYNSIPPFLAHKK